ncbi:hypothetical protein HanPSC8_Chr01g0021291 [Helianthus annuus]|nr:hypothetical protein HanPSC8_Chr01g0021291 [Helianthus annuus]
MLMTLIILQELQNLVKVLKPPWQGTLLIHDDNWNRLINSSFLTFCKFLSFSYVV